jgi:peptide/nickel transport system permease protein
MTGATSRLISRRLVAAIPVIFIVATGIFLLLEIAPGDAVDAYLASTAGGDAALAEQLRQAWGLDQSLPIRYFAYLQAVFTLDLGWSVAANAPVLEAIAVRLPNTILLMGAAIIVAALLGVLLGAIAAMRRGGATDAVITSTGLALNAMPNFWVALILIVVFVVALDWFPLSGMSTIGGPTDPLGRVLDTAWHLVLPVLTLSLTYMAIYMRLMRGAMVETRSSGWVRAARARGLPSGRIVRGHIARPALLPVVTMLGLQAGAMLGGSVVIETVFAIPGLGSLAFLAVQRRDLPLVAGVVLAGTVLVIVINLIVDLSYVRLDPRVADDRASRPAR